MQNHSFPCHTRKICKFVTGISPYLPAGDRTGVPVPRQPDGGPTWRLLALPELPGRVAEDLLALGVGHLHVVDVVEAADLALLHALLGAGAPGTGLPGIVPHRAKRDNKN